MKMDGMEEKRGGRGWREKHRAGVTIDYQQPLS